MLLSLCACADRSCYDCCRLKDAGFPVRLLPRVVPAGHVAGQTKLDLCGLIPAETDVLVATGDAQCSIISTRIQPHQAGNRVLFIS